MIGLDPINRTCKVLNSRMYLLDSGTIHGFAFLTTKQVDRGVVDTIANSDELTAF
jgi:hypothetical protein